MDPLVEAHDDFEPARDCPREGEAIERRARQINEALTSTEWRPMERLPPGELAVRRTSSTDYASVKLHSLYGDRGSRTLLVLMVESAYESMECTPCFRAFLEPWEQARLASSEPGACAESEASPDPCATPGSKQSEGYSPFALHD
jgi:hypothetical protein